MGLTIAARSRRSITRIFLRDVWRDFVIEPTDDLSAILFDVGDGVEPATLRQWRPGANIEAITERVENIVGSGKSGSVLVHVGTNNIERVQLP